MMDAKTRNDLGETAIFSAIIHKNMDTVDVLIDHGCDINSVWQMSTPIYLMLCNKDVEGSSKVIDKGALITTLPDEITQPLRAVLDVCHTQAITYQTMRLLRMMVQADCHVVQHLQSYSCSKPGHSEQDIVYHIYRMENGPAQIEGKLLIRSLVKLGYTPTKGELATMSQSDFDYDYLYSCIKCGPAPLKDLCMWAIRDAYPINVTYSFGKNTSSVTEKERMQILLQPPSQPEHDYENVQVFKRTKEGRRSKHKSLKEIMSGIGRLSRRFSKKNPDKPDGSSHLSLSLPSKESGKRPSTSSKPTIKPKPRLKSKYTKQDAQVSANATAVADIVKRYSTESKPDNATADQREQQPSIIAIDNPAYLDNATYDGKENFVSSIAVVDSRLDLDKHISEADTDVTIKFNEVNTSRKPENATVDDTSKSGECVQTPMTNHAPELSSHFTYKASIHIEDDETM